MATKQILQRKHTSCLPTLAFWTQIYKRVKNSADLIINNWISHNLHYRETGVELPSQKNRFPRCPKCNQKQVCPPRNVGLCLVGISGEMFWCSPAQRLSAAVEPRQPCDVCVNSFTALRPPQLPSPLFLAATEVIPAPHSLPKLLPHRQPIAALRVRWNCTIVGQKRGDIPTSSWFRPRVPYHRREVSEIPACSLRVSTAVWLREAAGMSCFTADSPTPTPKG